MRIRVTTLPPLPSIQVWYPLPEPTLSRASTSRLAQQPFTIQSLKERLCSDLTTLRNLRIREEDVVLVMDEFELLDSSGVDVLRDGDLIWCGPTSSYCFVMYADWVG
jgi:hypothetical protein